MKDGKLNGKIAVITGASKGIGAGIAKEFAAEGAAVAVNYASAKHDADRVVDEISKRGGKAVAIQGNVAKKADVERLFADAEKAFGKIDIVVNNAGIYEFVPLEEITEQQFHRMFDTNVLGILLTTQEALKHFRVTTILPFTKPKRTTISRAILMSRINSTIVAAQERLALQGYYRGETDGVLSPETQKAVKRYQMTNGLRATGYLDTQTLAVMGLRTSASY